MKKHDFAFCVSIALLTFNISAHAKAPNADTLGHNDYSKKMNWLCWPGKIGDACKSDMRSTIIQADGSTTIEHFKADAKAPIDCFYVYPTASKETTQLSDLKIQDAWNYYLTHENKCRGIVFIGHSQGSRMLKQLLAEEIDGKPIQSQLISAIIPGGNVTVAKGSDVG